MIVFANILHFNKQLCLSFLMLFFYHLDLHFCEDIKLPMNLDGRMSLEVGLTFFNEDGTVQHTSAWRDTVQFSSAKNLTLVQTDKPIYKPGETVKFRALTLDTDLMVFNEAVSQISLSFTTT